METLTKKERAELESASEGMDYGVCDKALRIIDAQAAEIEKLRAQLPEGMQHCTIQFVACPIGHGRLTAANWVDRGCDVCQLDILRKRVTDLVKGLPRNSSLRVDIEEALRGA